jgi:hypothetical protein
MMRKVKQMGFGRRSRTWVLPATISAISCIGAVAGNLVATDIQPILGPYHWVPWVVAVASFSAAVVAAIRDSRKNASDYRAAEATTSVEVGGDLTGIVTIGTSNSVTQSTRLKRTR